ncbi:hypothetical protein ACGFZA_00530 [Streptomyces sp. NPDC048211]|uniref:hypothetical protein n=1 Tax=Streptomyces sp. NPDC048211 TaxID=3365516 RepID=UPI00371BB8DE
MGDFEFEIEPMADDWASGYRGTVGPFGSVTVRSEISKPREGPKRQVILEGARFPDTLFSGGVGVSPSLDGGWLGVDGGLVGMDVKVKGIRKGSRWLELTYRERHYLYTSTGAARKARLHREGATVTMDRGRFVPMSADSGQGRLKEPWTPTILPSPGAGRGGQISPDHLRRPLRHPDERVLRTPPGRAPSAMTRMPRERGRP